MMTSDIVIVTKHQALIDWLAGKGIVGEVYPRVERHEVKGKRVFGSIPLYLAAEALEYNTVVIPRIRDAMDPQNVTLEEMNELKAYITTFHIEQVRSSV